MLRRTFLNLSAAPLRTFACRSIPPEHDIIRAFRQGDFETAITLFSQRPHSRRSDALHEAAILACAQVPDAVAAQAVLNSMAKPTHPAVASVVTALCRERDATAAVDVLERVSKSDVKPDHRLLASVSRAVDRCNVPDLSARLTHLRERAAHVGGPLSAAGFFVDGGCEQPLPEWEPERPGRPRQQVEHIVNAEQALRAASGRVRSVDAVWARVKLDESLRTEVGVLSAAINAFVASGRSGPSYAINTLMTWVRELLYDERTGNGVQRYTSNPSSMALLLTATTKALAAAARSDSHLALSAYDVLDAMRLPSFVGSLPLTGAYFKVLQHANLSLVETRERIDRVWEQHLQFDEQAFSMALGAILRCNARVSEKLNAGRAWTAVMRSAGIPLTLHTYNLFAGQLRYCNDPELVMSLLADMSAAGVNPSGVTYGLVFSACVMQGDYGSSARKNALPVALWLEVLQAMEGHMRGAGVPHTSYSLLSLARAYAHLGRTSRALQEFDAFTESLKKSVRDERTLNTQLVDGYGQMAFNFAHCRECSLDGPDAAFSLFNHMKAAGLRPNGVILDSLLVASVRTGKAMECISFAKEFTEEGYDLRINVSGLKHLLKAHTELQNPTYWEQMKSVILENEDILRLPQLKSTVEELVIRFARCGRRDLCDELMDMASVSVVGLDFVLKGREFSRFRSRPRKQSERSDEHTLTPGYSSSSSLRREESLETRSHHSQPYLDETEFRLG